MLIRRALISANISDNEFFFANSEQIFVEGSDYLFIREQMLDDSSILVLLDNTLLDDEEKRKWLTANLHNQVWLRVTGTLELHSYTYGMYERKSTGSHRPTVKEILNLIAVEIISDHELTSTTSPHT